MITAKEFRDKYLGQAIDVDGAAGVQCVDLFKQACYLVGKSAFALGGSGYADEIVHRFDALGLGDYFDLVSLANAQYGDWIVWDKGSTEATDSHVAMFVGWQGDSRVIVLGQNQFSQKASNEGAISTNGIIGVLRLKEWATVEEPTPEVPSTSLNYGVGTPVCVEQLNTQSNGGELVPSHVVGVIGRVIQGATYPYRVDRDGEAIGWVNDDIIDADPHVPGATQPSTPSGTLKGSAIKYWTVDPGDTLSGIAVEMGQTVDALAKHNDISNPNLIRVGQVIYNPGYKG